MHPVVPLFFVQECKIVLGLLSELVVEKKNRMSEGMENVKKLSESIHFHLWNSLDTLFSYWKGGILSHTIWLSENCKCFLHILIYSSAIPPSFRKSTPDMTSSELVAVNPRPGKGWSRICPPLMFFANIKQTNSLMFMSFSVPDQK